MIQLRLVVLMSFVLTSSLAACGSDDGDGDGDGGDAGTSAPDADLDADSSPAAPSPGTDTTNTMPTAKPPANMEPRDMGDEDAGTDSDDGDDATDATPVVLPTDGNARSVCASDDDCNGDDLVCEVHGFYRGYCTEDCSEDTDCPAVDGVEATCNSGSCTLDCEGDGSGDGKCPANMECAKVSDLLSVSFVCQYPEPKDQGLYDPCDGLRGSSDCQEGLTCDVFVGLPLLSDLAEPYCAETCMEDADCSDVSAEATPVCDRDSILVSEGQCALECQNDKQCPGEMLCIAIDPLQRRCGYPLL